MVPKFSIVTCTRNSIETLPQTIASVQSQTYRSFEHIFVDGGSTDGTLECIAEHCPGAVVLTGVTGGIAKAMNKGLEVARGEVVAHLHSDDYYSHPGVLGRVAGCFEAESCQLVVGRTDMLEDGVVTPGPALGHFSRWKFRARRYYFPHPSTFMRTSLMRELGGFDASIRYAMDIDLWLRAIRVAEPVVLEETLAVFRVHDGSLSSANQRATVKDEWSVRRKYVKDDPLAAPFMAVRMLKHVYMAE
jgi:glycosyltransferase involved in cell wall biosynthesis